MSSWTYLTRKQHRAERNIPDWVPLGEDDPNFKLLFMEDDARPPDMEFATGAWVRIFGEQLPVLEQALAKWDGGDCMAYLMPGNRVYESSYDGASIYQWLPPRKFPPCRECGNTAEQGCKLDCSHR